MTVTAERQRNPVARAFRVIRWMTEQPGDAWGVRQIAAGAHMHPSTVHRLLAMLEAENLVHQDEESGRYALGLEFIRLAWRTASRDSLARVALPVLRRLRDETGETAMLGIYDESRRAMTLIASVESQHAVRNIRPLHTWMPVHGGATGRALLAFLPDEERAAILGGELAAVTGATISDRGELVENLASVRRLGYAVSRGERVPGGVGVAAPIIAGGTLIGVVGITMPEQRYARGDETRLAPLVVAAARDVAERLGPAA